MAIYGYCRVSTDMQDAEQQAYNIKQKFVVDDVFMDVGVSGYKKKCLNREGFKAMWGVLKKGDTVIVISANRFGRDLVDTAQVLDAMEKKGVVLVDLRMGFDTSTIMGKAMISMLLGFAEVERANIVCAVKEGLKKARAEGKQLGAAKRFSDEEIKEAYQKYHTQVATAEALGMSRKGLYKRLKTMGMI
ncbi:recombinase family protein [Escherichia coli]